MKITNRALFSFFFMFLLSKLNAIPTPLGQIKFDGGYNLSKNRIDLSDNESNEMCNCIVESDGGLAKVKGSKRFVAQALSTYPVNSLFRYYASSGTSVNKTLLAVVGNSLVNSTGGIVPFWTTITSGLISGDRWNWLTFNNTAIGVSPNNRAIKYDVNSTSLSFLLGVDVTTNPLVIQSKYSLMSKNYFIMANVLVSTNTFQDITISTYYPSRIYFSLLLQPSSMTWNRYIEYRTNNGEEITGIGSEFDAVHIFKPTSIAELTFSVLNLTSQGGDFSLKEIASGFGLEAPYTLQKKGTFYIMGTKSAISMWDGGRHARATSDEEFINISKDIQPLIEKLIKSGTYRESVGKYYDKRNWYILSYRDPEKFPKDKLNSLIVYDFKTKKWYPICGHQISSFETFLGAGDNGELIMGDSGDSYVYQGDIGNNFARKEIPLDTMDSSANWINSTQDLINMLEGTASLKMSISAVTTQTSMTITKAFPLGEWNDKTKVTKDDKFSFKTFIDSYTNMTSLRVDLEVKDIDKGSPFDLFFTSITISSPAITADKSWTTFEIPLSSFPIRNDWTDLNIESSPFANTLNYYGIRFVFTGINSSTISIDDLRLVQSGENPVKFNWTSKLFNFGDISNKNFGELILSYDKTPESILKVDFINNFGDRIRSTIFDRDTNKELLVTKSTATLVVFSSIDFSIKNSSNFNTNEFTLMNGNSDNNFTILLDRNGQRIVKLDRKIFGTIISTYGSLGSGTTNFNVPNAVKIKGNSILATDENNHRIKEHSLSDLSFIKMAGTLGLGSTSYHVPSGISINENEASIVNEGNYKITKISLSTFGFNSDYSIDFNKIAGATLEEDSKYLYLAYEKIAVDSLFNIDIILEKRIKTSGELVNRSVVRTLNSVSGSTYNIRGDIALVGNNLFISFTDDFKNNNRNFFIQKLNKDDFSVVQQYVTTDKIWSLLGYSKSYLPTSKVERIKIGESGVYFQERFYDDELDNFIKLYNQTVLVEPTPLSYGGEK